MQKMPMTLNSLAALVIGVVVILILIARPGRQRAKGFLIAFAVVGLVLPGLLRLTLQFGFSSRMNYFTPRISPGLQLLFLISRNCSWFGSLFLIPLAWDISSEKQERVNDSIVLGSQWRTKNLTAGIKHSVMRRREWALLIDHTPLFVYALVRGIRSAMEMERLPSVQAEVAILAVLSVVWWILYLPAKDMIFGVSLGKYITKCRVVDFESGVPISLPQSLLRNVPLLFPGFALIECAVALTRSDRRRLGDLMANTIVVKGDPAFINGVEVPQIAEVVETPLKHPLD